MAEKSIALNQRESQDTVKRCSVCKQSKDLALFSKNKNNRDGRTNECKDCRKLYRERNKDKIKAYGAEYRKTYTIKSKPPFIGDCGYCGKQITGRKRKYCDKQCRDAYKIEHRKVYGSNCLSCGKYFYAYVSDQKCCSVKCSGKYNGLKRAQRSISDSCKGYKQCRECGKVKKLSEYYKHRNSADGFASYCRDCRKLKWKLYVSDELVVERINVQAKVYRNTDIGKQKIKEKNRKNLPERLKKEKERRRTDLKFALSRRVTVGIWHSLRATKSRKGGRKWEDLVGYNTNQLERRLKKTMPNGYGWKDFLNGDLHIDHIVPQSAFNFRSHTDMDFRRCWSLKNLQLLPAKENIIKQAKLEKPFQPCLSFG